MSKPEANREEEILEAILQAGAWEIGGDYTLAGGRRANNIFNLPAVLSTLRAKELLVGRMVELTAAYEPDLIWGVPRGGQQFAEEIARRIDVELLMLDKDDPVRKSVKLVKEKDRRLIERASRVVGVEDVGTEFTSTIGALQSPQLPELSKTLAMIIGLRRGTKRRERQLWIPVDAAVTRTVNLVMDNNDPFFKQYGHYAVGHGQEVVD